MNVGPNQYGIIPEVCQQNLREMGDWLKVNGEAIYGTQASPFPFLSWGRATRKARQCICMFLIGPKMANWLSPFRNKITKAYLLADAKTNLKVSPEKKNQQFNFRHYAPDKIASVVAVEFEGEPVVLPVPSQGAKVTATSIDPKTVNFSYITDGDPKNRWQAAKGEKSATLEIDLGKPVYDTMSFSG